MLAGQASPQRCRDLSRTRPALLSNKMRQCFVVPWGRCAMGTWGSDYASTVPWLCVLHSPPWSMQAISVFPVAAISGHPH